MPDERSIINAIEQAFARIQQAGVECQSGYSAWLAEIETQYKQQLASSKAKYQQGQTAASNSCAQQKDAITHRFQQTRVAIRQQVWATSSTLGLIALDWNAPAWNQFTPLPAHAAVPLGVRLGVLKVSTPFPLPPIPALIPLIGRGHLVISFHAALQDASAALLQSATLRFAASFPAGAFRFALFDPFGMGSKITPFLTLPEMVRGDHVCCSEHEVEEELALVYKHIQNVIQTRLGSSFKSIEEYNARVGEVSAPYRFLIIPNFPAGFNDQSTQRLLDIARNGPRAGVYILATYNLDAKPPFSFDAKAFLDTAAIVSAKGPTEFAWTETDFAGCAIVPDRLPSDSQVKQILGAVGKAAIEQGSQGLAFKKIMVSQPVWSRKSDERINVAVGLNGSGAAHEFEVGTGVVHHALVGGQTGSGKTNLLHVLITNLAMAYSPEELELYLVDFKEGVEFQDYASMDLPHARAVAIETEREFGLSILHRLQQEMETRGNLFRTASVTSLLEYRRKTGKSIPRVLLIVDEYQVLFAQDDRLSMEASNVLGDLVRRGRSFGIHILLSSQSPASTFISNRAVYEQIALRICLPCRESDARLILGDDNDAAKSLENPGEAIYNAENGRPDKNTFLRVALLPHAERLQYLSQARQLAQQRGYKRSEPLAVFKGSEPAQIPTNRILWQMIWNSTYGNPKSPAQVWLGEAIEIKPHTAAVFERQSRSNLLIVGQEESYARGMVVSALLSLCPQRRPKEVMFFALDFGNPDADPNAILTRIKSAIPHSLEIVTRADAAGLLERLSKVVGKRTTQSGNPNMPQIFFFFFGMHRFRELRSADPYVQTDAAKILAQICQDGPEVGVHSLIWCDTMASFERVLQRRGLDNFDARVALLMSQNDSNTLLDGPQASKLGPNRALFRNQEWEAGRIEKFKPYMLPEPQVVDTIGRRFQRKN